jgi:hypothetical protein
MMNTHGSEVLEDVNNHKKCHNCDEYYDCLLSIFVVNIFEHKDVNDVWEYEYCCKCGGLINKIRINKLQGQNHVDI